MKLGVASCRDRVFEASYIDPATPEIGNCGTIRARPDPSVNIVSWGCDRTILETSERQQSGDLIAVKIEEHRIGWINKQYFSRSALSR
jgi:hypothetical protein